MQTTDFIWIAFLYLEQTWSLVSAGHLLNLENLYGSLLLVTNFRSSSVDSKFIHKLCAKLGKSNVNGDIGACTKIPFCYPTTFTNYLKAQKIETNILANKREMSHHYLKRCAIFRQFVITCGTQIFLESANQLNSQFYDHEINQQRSTLMTQARERD